jgi:hypothetical protein
MYKNAYDYAITYMVPCVLSSLRILLARDCLASDGLCEESGICSATDALGVSSHKPQCIYLHEPHQELPNQLGEPCEGQLGCHPRSFLESLLKILEAWWI